MKLPSTLCPMFTSEENAFTFALNECVCVCVFVFTLVSQMKYILYLFSLSNFRDTPEETSIGICTSMHDTLLASAILQEL